ncbi:pilus assembly FimT family protein [Candidatus Protochlamydia phocaeensis]|uniref:pilus assembly FimT family protein n=1 Tax=Candidatus Protochlamydia phocaeensis TaxID=1414722 RepID=UPI000838093B|nr:type II secretion system protein [Candidatus Protochlamydia phocaeensis]
MRIVRQPCFTLLELLIVLFILSLGLALTGVKLKEAYDEQRFASEVQQVLDRLRMAQDLMLIMNADVQVCFSRNAKTKQIECKLDIEKPIKDGWANLIERPLALSAIRSYQFNGSQDDPLILRFSLGKMSQGQLTLLEASEAKEARKDFIELPGYPSPLVRGGRRIKEKERSEESQQLYPIEVYEELYLKKD